MIGANGQTTGLIDFNSSSWADTANAQLQAALQQGLQYSEKYTNQAVKATEDYNKLAQQQMQQGFQQAQALNAPQRLATYGALDTYQDILGLSRPAAGSAAYAASQAGPPGLWGAGPPQGIPPVLTSGSPPAPQGMPPAPWQINGRTVPPGPPQTLLGR